MKKEVLNFYKKTSLYTDLGLYKEQLRYLSGNIKELSLFVRNTSIHPFDLLNEEEKNDKNNFYGDMTQVPNTSLVFENDLLPTALSMIAELYRRNSNFINGIDITDKIHVCCRENAILLCALLKLNGYSARVRSGFTNYVTTNFQAGDHWITEYYDEINQKWILVDCCMMYDKEILDEFKIDFDLLDIPRDKFIFGAQAYLGLRNKVYKEDEIYYASDPVTLGLKAALRGLFYDFHSLMNDEIIFLHVPAYIVDKNFELSEEEYQELDKLAKLMLDPDKNFYKLKHIWDNEPKFRIMKGGLN